MMSYSLATLLHERQRFLPGVLAVAFSALLIALQCGLLLGLFSLTSTPVDHTTAHIWVGSPKVLSVDLGRPIPQRYMTRVTSQPEVAEAEVYLQGFAYWYKPAGGSELCMVIGSRLEEGSMGLLKDLTPDLRARLTEPDTIAVDESELARLGLTGAGATAEISGRKVRVVGLVQGIKSLAGPFVFCSIRTAHHLLPIKTDQTVFVLARCKDPADAPRVVERLRRYDDMSVFTADEFSLRTRLHWLTATKGGIALGYAAALGLLVGAVVTSQTLFAATMASIKEYAVLRALGIPRWRMAATVLAQSFWVGLAGLVIALPVVLLLARGADLLGVPVRLPPWLLGGASVITMAMAMLSGMMALRSLRQVEPVSLLR